MKNLLIMLSMIMLSSFAFANTQLRVTTWNIYWLGSDGKNIRTDKDYSALSEYANKMSSDIIALQEVESADYAKKVFGDAYTYTFTSNPHVQRVGFAIKERPGYNYTVKEFSELNVGDVRPGLLLTVKNNESGKELNFLAVHLKSGCFDEKLSTNQLSKDCNKLKSQLPILDGFIKTYNNDSKPLIIMGDFNRRLGVEAISNYNEADGIWPEIDDPEIAPQHNLTLINEGGKSMCWNGKYPDFIDHFIFNELAMETYEKDSFSTLIYQEPISNMNLLSDHCPISININL